MPVFPIQCFWFPERCVTEHKFLKAPKVDSEKYTDVFIVTSLYKMKIALLVSGFSMILTLIVSLGGNIVRLYRVLKYIWLVHF